MVNPNRIVLTDNSGGNAVVLAPRVRDDGTRDYREFRLPSLTPRTALSEDQVSFAQVPPEQELVWAQRDWSLGQGAFYYVDGFYAEANGVDARKQSELSLASLFQNTTDANATGPTGYSLFGTNTNAEASATIFTTVTGTHTRVTSVFNEGVASWVMTNNGAAAFKGSLTAPIGTPTIATNITLKAVAMVRGINTGKPEIFIEDSSGVVAGTSNSGTSFAEVSVSDSVTTTIVGWGIRDAESLTGGESIGYLDEAALFQNDYAASTKVYAVAAGAGADSDVLGLAGMLVNVNANYVGEITYLSNTLVTDLEAFNGRVYASFGTGANVVNNATPSGASWVENTTTPFKATKLSRALTANGEYAFARAYTNSDGTKVVALTTDPSAASPVWSTDTQVGDSNAAFTNLFEYGGTLYAAKEDGLFRYEPYIPGTSVPATRFVKVSPDTRLRGITTGSDFFTVDKFMERNGWAYFILTNKQFWRYSQSQNLWHDLTDLVRNDAVTDRGGRVVAMAQDSRNIYVAVQGSSSEFDIVVIRERSGVEFVTHTLHTLSATQVQALWMRANAVNIANAYTLEVLYAYPFTGGSTAVPQMRSLVLPKDHEIMRHNTTVRVHPSGELITSYMDWNSPDVRKSFNTLTILSEGASTNTSIALGYEVDNETSFSTLPTVTQSPSQTVSFPSGTTGRRIRLRYALAAPNSGGSGAASESPVLRGHVLRASWRPTRLRAWEFTTEVSQGDHYAAGELLTTLRTLEQKVAPLKFTPMDSATAIDVHIRDVESSELATQTGQGQAPIISRLVRIRLDEAVTS